MDANDSLSLDPNGQFAEEIGEWQDGQTYNVALQIKQTAPGKFEVVSMTESSEATEPAESEAPPKPAKKMTGNPAVDGMMQ